MKYLISLLLFCFSVSGFSQNETKIISNCNEDIYAVNADEKPVFEHAGQNVYDYLNAVFTEKKVLKDVNGSLFIGIVIFSNGKTCCKSIGNLTGSEIDTEELKKTINEMPEWKPAKQDGKFITYLYNLMLNVDNGKITKE